MILLGLGGTNGSGKDTVAQILVDKHGFMFISTSNLLRKEAESRGLSTDRENLRTISAEWRRQYGLGVLVDRAVEEFKNNPGSYIGLVVSSLRNPAEADAIHEHGGKMVWVDADPKVRFDRLSSRGRQDDPKDLNKFIKDEQAEMQHSGDEATLSLSGVKHRSDVTIINEGNNLDLLNQTITELLGLSDDD